MCVCVCVRARGRVCACGGEKIDKVRGSYFKKPLSYYTNP